MTGEPSFFEIGVEDPVKAEVFYGELFGWSFGDVGGGARIATAGLPGGLHGGDAGAAPYLFFAVHDLDAAVAHVIALGGGVLDDLADDPDSVAEFGRFRLCTDDQGSRFGLHQRPS